jgi:hypothetical protein
LETQHLEDDAMTMTSVPEGDRQLRLVRVHHEHREELGRLRLAGIGTNVACGAKDWGSPLTRIYVVIAL